MPNLYQFSQTEILAFFLVLVRLSAFVVAWPVFGVTTVPHQVKILFALTMAMMIFPVVNWQGLEGEALSHSIIWLAIREGFIGLAFGFLAKMFFFAVSIAAQIMSVSIGLGSSQLFNPALGEQVTTLDQFQLAIATLFFLAINGHHLFVSGIMDSFRLVPLEAQLLSVQGFKDVGGFVQEIMMMGLKLSAPVMVAVLFMNLAMAVVGRVVPQINVLITSLPVNILTGLGVMVISLPLLLWYMHDLLELTSTRLFQLLKTF